MSTYRPCRASSPSSESTLLGDSLAAIADQHRVLRPALRDAGIAVKVGEDDQGRDVWDYRGVAFHAFRKACGSLLLAHGKRSSKCRDGCGTRSSPRR